MKLLIVSDIHGSLYYTKKLVEVNDKVKPDKIVILGDILYNSSDNIFMEEVLEEISNMLNGLKDKIVAVRGNCDREIDQVRLDFDISSDYKVLDVDGYRFILTHGHLNYKLPELGDKDILLNGHTHVYKLEDRYINPGSISKPRKNTEHTFIVYEDKKFSLYDIDMNLLDSLNIR